ncbi:MAG: tyrosine-type recombinase/integrase [Eubacteriales bacterium]|nr:tyrosine-type recombinase/integrase [Eubacteriales bacterium]
MAKKRADGEGTIRKRADGRWEARYSDPRELDPKKRQKSIIRKSQREATQQLKALLAEIDSGVPSLTHDNPTLEEWFKSWLEDYAINKLRDGTFESYEMHVRSYINPHIGKVKLKELTGVHIQRMYNKLQEPKANDGANLSGASIAKIKTILSGALQQAILNRIIRINPLLETKPPKVEDTDIRILTKEEQRQFIAVLPFFNTGNMFSVALATGMRVGELCALEIGDIDRANKQITINKAAARRKDKYTGEVGIKVGAPKTKNSIRRIPLLPSVEIMIDRQLKLNEEMREQAGANWRENILLFPTDEGNIHDLSGMRSAMGRILKRAGLPHMTIHSLRHTYATTALNSGVAAQNVAKLLGHKDGATTLKFYAHYINTEAMTQLQSMEEQNVSHLGITAAELQSVMRGAETVLERTSVNEKIDEAIARSKNMPPKKSVEQVLSVCEDILCQSPQNLTQEEKEVLLGVLAQYSVMKRQIAEQERVAKNKKRGVKGQDR